MRKPILCLDFDGVLHSYESGWQGATVIPDPPVSGALEFIVEAIGAGFEVHIFSSRSGQPYGIAAMQDWLRKHSRPLLETVCRDDPMLCFLDCIEWPREKPPAMVTIDDRAIQFTGEWPSLDDLKNFKPWNKR